MGDVSGYPVQLRDKSLRFGVRVCLCVCVYFCVFLCVCCIVVSAGVGGFFIACLHVWYVSFNVILANKFPFADEQCIGQHSILIKL